MCEWISVNDKTPECDVKVLAFMSDGRIEWIDVIWHWSTRGFDYDLVRYWMPLPKPPRDSN